MKPAFSRPANKQHKRGTFEFFASSAPWELSSRTQQSKRNMCQHAASEDNSRCAIRNCNLCAHADRPGNAPIHCSAALLPAAQSNVPLLRTEEEAANARLAPKLLPQQYRKYNPSQLVAVNRASVYSMLWWMLAGLAMNISTAVATTRSSCTSF